MTISPSTAAELLRGWDDIVILAHQKPDGDTLGSCFALLYALEALGKTARVECADGYPARYHILYGNYAPKPFTPRFVVACDVASAELLGPLAEKYPSVDLCIDHHKSNTLYAAHTLLDAAAAATAQAVYHVIAQWGLPPDARVATALYTGISTDTGCFRFANVTPETHLIAAELIKHGADHRAINKQMFDNKSRGRVAVEKFMYDTLEFYQDGRVALICLPADILERYGVTEEDLDGISAFPRRIEGVLCGITLREKQDGAMRVSLRCEPPLDASRICARFGGGGHTGAAGCTMAGPPEQARGLLLQAICEEFAAMGL